jgi:DNA-binding ferritin-like protein
MKEAPYERTARHLTLIAERVQRLTERPPRTCEELDMQRIFADAAIEVALEVVCELLPLELQPTVKRLVALRRAIWHRGVETEEVQA